LRHVEPIQPVTCQVDNEARFPKSFLKELGGLGFVFDDQNSHRLGCARGESTQNVKRIRSRHAACWRTVIIAAKNRRSAWRRTRSAEDTSSLIPSLPCLDDCEQLPNSDESYTSVI